MKRYPLIQNFSGVKFGQRYNLNPIEGKFFVDGDGMLVVPDNLPDNPPIQEPNDPVIPSPAGIFVHEMKALSKKQGNELIDGDGTSCLHIVVNTEAQLSDPWFNGVAIEMGSVAYVVDKSKTMMWDGVKWK